MTPIADIIGERFIDKLRVRQGNTPDYPYFADYKNIPVFVYNHLQSGNNENETVLKNATFLGAGKTCSNRYSLRNPYFPTVFAEETRSSANCGFIKGEVYCVRPKVMFDLDVFHNNEFAFKRRKVSVFLEDQRVMMKGNTIIPSIQAWMYIGVKSFWDNFHLELYSKICPQGDKKKGFYKCFRVKDISENIFPIQGQYGQWPSTNVY